MKEWTQLLSIENKKCKSWTAAPNLSVVSWVCCFLCMQQQFFISSLVAQCRGNTTSPPKGWRGFGWIKTRGLNSVWGHMRYSVLRRLVSPFTNVCSHVSHHYLLLNMGFVKRITLWILNVEDCHFPQYSNAITFKIEIFWAPFDTFLYGTPHLRVSVTWYHSNIH